MASNTNPRVRRINQLLRIRNTEDLPDGYHYGKATYSGGYNSLGTNFNQCQLKEHNVNPAIGVWNYNAYPSKDQANLPKANVTGENTFKVGNTNLSDNFDNVDKTYQRKKYDEHYEKQVRKDRLMGLPDMKTMTHGQRNAYPSFNDLLGHQYVHGPETENLKNDPYNTFNTTYDLNHNDKHNPFINSHVVQPRHLPLTRKLPGENKKAGNIQRTFAPAHQDEEFLPSHDVRQKDRPDTLGQFYLNQSFQNPGQYESFQSQDFNRRAISIGNRKKNANPNVSGVDFEVERLYQPIDKQKFTYHSRRDTAATRLYHAQTKSDFRTSASKEFGTPRNTCGLYKNIGKKVDDKREIQPGPPTKIRDHLYFDGIDQKPDRYRPINLKRSRTSDSKRQNLPENNLQHTNEPTPINQDDTNLQQIDIQDNQKQYNMKTNNQLPIRYADNNMVVQENEPVQYGEF